MLLRLTDHQLAALNRLSDRASGAVTASDVLARAIAFDAEHPSPGPPRRRRPADASEPADVILDTVLPAATGRALTLAAGQILRIEQLAGGQCADLTAFEWGEPRRPFSAARTRAEHGIHPTTGATLLSTPPEIPLLTIVEDTCPLHDLTFPACTPFEYEPLTGRAGHLNCHAIHTATQRRAGVDRPVPDPLNLWLPSAVTRAGQLRSWPATCRGGDYVELRAHTEVLVVVSACPDDLYGSSQYEPKPMRLIVCGADRDGDRPARSRPRITRRLTTPRAATARHTVAVTLTAPARTHLNRVRDAGQLGDSDEEVARALLCRFIERSPQAAAKSLPTASSTRTGRRPRGETPAAAH